MVTCNMCESSVHAPGHPDPTMSNSTGVLYCIYTKGGQQILCTACKSTPVCTEEEQEERTAGRAQGSKRSRETKGTKRTKKGEEQPRTKKAAMMSTKKSEVNKSVAPTTKPPKRKRQQTTKAAANTERTAKQKQNSATLSEAFPFTNEQLAAAMREPQREEHN